MPNTQQPTPSAMQWFFLIMTLLWIFATLAIAVFVFYLTRNPYSFTLIGGIAPPLYILRRIVNWLFPKNESDYTLAMKRLECAAKLLPSRKKKP